MWFLHYLPFPGSEKAEKRCRAVLQITFRKGEANLSMIISATKTETPVTAYRSLLTAHEFGRKNRIELLQQTH